MAKLINKPENVVSEMIQGALYAHPDLMLLKGQNVLLRRDYQTIKEEQVVLISGGGSGHEPAHAGFIGDGMLTAAVLGGVFASPTAAAVLAAITECTGKKGCLLIVKNYTGDRLNFGIAAEKAKAKGLRVKMIIVGDDVAVNAGDESDGTITGRRGLAGTCFVHKICGAAAKSGASLSSVYDAAVQVCKSTGSMGVALSTCTVPGTERSTRIPPGHIELGLGIHGEPGRELCKSKPVDNIVATILKKIDDIVKLEGEKQIVVMINNLGGTPLMELYVVANAVRNYLHNHLKASVIRFYTGSFMTSLEMQGCMVTCMKITSELQLCRLDMQTCAPAWPKPSQRLATVTELDSHSHIYPLLEVRDLKNTFDASEEEFYVDAAVTGKIKSACDKIIAAEDELSKLDSIVGDGDCGSTLRKGAAAILDNLKNLSTKRPIDLMGELSYIVGDSMGGSSGALTEIMLNAAAASFKDDYDLDQNANWGKAFLAGVNAASYYGGAKRGYRTCLDSLIPAAEAAFNGSSSAEIILAAREGANATADMKPLAGRSSYLKMEQVNGTKDPGAVAASIIIEALLQ
eukprot:g11280.t1